MKKLKKFLLIILCFMFVYSVNAFAEEYEDYTITVPMRHRYSRTITNGVFNSNIQVDRSYGSGENMEHNINEGSAFAEGISVADWN